MPALQQSGDRSSRFKILGNFSNLIPSDTKLQAKILETFCASGDFLDQENRRVKQSLCRLILY